MTPTKTLFLVLIVIVAAFVGMSIFPANPLWKSQAHIKDWILKDVPLGSSIHQVNASIKKHGWRLVAEWNGNSNKASSDTAYPSIKDYPGVIGEHFIQVDLGKYQGMPFRVGVDACWGFDAAGRLVDLRVRKGAEGL